MKPQFSFILVALFFSIYTNAASDSVHIVTNVNRVIVFTQGAHVFRTKKVELKQGENTVYFSHLENSIDPQTIQLQAPGNSLIFNLIYAELASENHGPKVSDRNIKPIQDSLDFIDREVNILESQISNLLREKKLIETNSNIGNTDEMTYVERLEKLATFQRIRLNAIDTEIYDLNYQKTKLQAVFEAVNNRLQMRIQYKRFGLIKAKIYVEKAFSGEIDLNYIVQNAGWTPLYEIKANDLASPLEVSCKATVNQNTGVNWDNIQLTLSTRKRISLSDIPQVHPWVLYFHTKHQTYTEANQLINPNAISNMSVPLTTSFTVTPTAPIIDPSAYLDRYQMATHKMINREYNINKINNLQGENGVAVVEIDHFEMKADFAYYAVPKYDPNVYLLAEVPTWESYDLVPAFGSIYLEGSYVGKVFIDPTNLEETLQIMLGKTDDILVERRKIEQESDKANRIIGSLKITNIGIEIIVKSKKNTPVQLIIKDQVPIAANPEISISVKEISKAQKDDKTGILTWRYTLKPGSTEKHTIRYEVTYPNGKTIFGI